MNFSKLIFAFIIAILLLAAACGGEKKTEELSGSARFFPAKFTQPASELTGEVETYVGDSLYEYFNGGGELFHLYNFVEVSTAIYKYGDAEIVLDLYQFDNPENAFGLYSMMRPDEPATINLGVEGFSSGASLDFVKGEFMVRLTGYDESATTIEGVRKMAAEMDRAISGVTSQPGMFALFPQGGMLAANARYYAEAYMGHSFLTRVYTQDYEIAADTFTLFVMEDEAGEKFLKWLQAAQCDESKTDFLKELSYDSDKAFGISSDYYGDIIVGLKGGKSGGIINLTDGNRDFFQSWLSSIQ
jgi:hypothetical protein